jgi:hypothetical protein
MIFGDYASDLAGSVAELEPGNVLETAAGSAVVTRALAARLGVATRYVVTDRTTESIAEHYGNGPVVAKVQAHIVTTTA